MDYQYWDLVPEFKVHQASCLWCDVTPRPSALFTRMDHPEIAAIEQLLVRAIKNGELPANTDEVSSYLPDYTVAVVTRADLKAFAESKGVRPGFLFPDQQSSVADPLPLHVGEPIAPVPPGLTASARRKGGEKAKYNHGLQDAVGLIVKDLGRTGTKPILSTIEQWLGRCSSHELPYSFEPPLPDCDELYIDGKKLVWKDRHGREQDIALRSLERYIKRAKTTDTS